MPRDADLTQKRILAAALTEFAAKGLAGARVDAIAERAGTSVRMLYHYFGNKDELYDEVLRQRVGWRAQGLDHSLSLREFLVQHYVLLSEDADFVRLVQWESLTRPGEGVVEQEERTAGYRRLVDHLKAEQAAGRLDAALEPDLLLVLVIALASFPVAFPAITSMITGGEPGTPRFDERYTAFLGALASRLTDSDAVNKEEGR
jgi:TetR/AcrR family transcriptional regulator